MRTLGFILYTVCCVVLAACDSSSSSVVPHGRESNEKPREGGAPAGTSDEATGEYLELKNIHAISIGYSAPEDEYQGVVFGVDFDLQVYVKGPVETQRQWIEWAKQEENKDKLVNSAKYHCQLTDGFLLDGGNFEKAFESGFPGWVNHDLGDKGIVIKVKMTILDK